jgi:hypothetical protein
MADEAEDKDGGNGAGFEWALVVQSRAGCQWALRLRWKRADELLGSPYKTQFFVSPILSASRIHLK